MSYAVDCVVEKIRQARSTVQSTDRINEARILQHYTKALRAVQAAIDDEVERTAPETLCATELLGVYEVCSAACPFIHC